MEIDLLKNLKHPQIVRYIDTMDTAEHMNIVLEYPSSLSLSRIVGVARCLGDGGVGRHMMMVVLVSDGGGVTSGMWRAAPWRPF